MYYDYDYEMYDDIYDDDAIIEAALDIYDEYDVSMEEAVDIAMEKVYRSIGGHEAKELEEKYPNTVWDDHYNSYYYHCKAQKKDDAFWDALRHAKNGGNNDPDRRRTNEANRWIYGDFGYENDKKLNRKIKFKDRVIDRGNPKPEPTPSAPTPIPNPKPTPSAPTPNPTPKPTPTPIKKRRINPKTGIAVGAGAAALGAGGVALYKYRKKKLAEAAKAQKEAEELDSRAARKREKAENAVAQAKEAASYFAY